MPDYSIVYPLGVCMSLILACGIGMKMVIKKVFGHTDVQPFLRHLFLEKCELDYPFISIIF